MDRPVLLVFGAVAAVGAYLWWRSRPLVGVPELLARPNQVPELLKRPDANGPAISTTFPGLSFAGGGEAFASAPPLGSLGEMGRA